MVSPAPEVTEPPPPRPRRWLRRLAVVTVVVVGLVVASTYVRMPYYAISPGSATPVSDYLVLPKGSAHPPTGQILLVTVSFSDVTPLEFIVGSLDSDTLLLSKKEADSGIPKGQSVNQYNRQLMDDSEQAAVVVALRRLGYPVTETGDGAFVVQVSKGGPSIGHIVVGETITAVGGQGVHTLDEATTAIHAHRAGDTVAVVLHPARGPDRTEQIAVGHRVSGQGGPSCAVGAAPAGSEPCFGVIIQTRNQSFSSPIKVKIDAGSIGGPSAGLSFTLGVIDELTAGELTGGQKIAVTGTIEIDGKVGPVGGVKQKTAAAIAAGARYFLVPPDEYVEARKRAKGHHLTVIKVTSLDEALTTLGRLGGDVSAVGGRPASG